MRLWPKRLREWKQCLSPKVLTEYHGIENLSVAAVAGNIAVASVPDLKQGNAVIAQVSQDAFVPQISVTNACLNLNSKPPLSSFSSQNARINTLCLVPYGLENISLSLLAGEIWYFGCYSEVPAPTSKLSMSNVAGDVILVDAAATRIDAKNRLGDVEMYWDIPEDMPDASLAMPAVVAVGETFLGDSTLTVTSPSKIWIRQCIKNSAAAGMTPWLTTKANVKAVDQSGAVLIMDGSPSKTIKQTKHSRKEKNGSLMREKWMAGTGKDFFFDKQQGNEETVRTL
jgi:hypothetical protein